MNDLIYELILESLSDYVESGELEFEEAEIIAESAYDELFDENALSRYVKRTMDDAKKLKQIEIRGPKNLAEQFKVKREKERLARLSDNDLIRTAREKYKFDRHNRKEIAKGDLPVNISRGETYKSAIKTGIYNRSKQGFNPQDLTLDERLKRLAFDKSTKNK